MGALRATFRELSGLTAGNWTRGVYRRLGETDVSVHVCAIAGRELPESGERGPSGLPGVAVCLVLPPDVEDGHAALVALETEPTEWVGTWTYDAAKVRWVDERLVEEF